MSSKNVREFPAEWHPQSAIQLTWPHRNTDWNYILEEVTKTYIELATLIAEKQKLLIVGQSIEEVKIQLAEANLQNIILREIDSDDTWARDQGPVTVLKNDKPELLDFGFNGWGGKFPFEKDNEINTELYQSGSFAKSIRMERHLDFILEGGSVESDGNGTLMTTSSCLLSKNRNASLDKNEIEQKLKETLAVKNVLWLNHGFLLGDDTDGHIDTLARFCPGNIIAYVQCLDSDDEHYSELQKMEEELRDFRNFDGKPYNLIPLPMADPVYENNERLPATYANFLITNEMVLVPQYGSSKDETAIEIISGIFPDREVIGINCSSLIKQGGSLHCITMQYPQGVI